MDYRKFLSKRETVVLPYFGGPRVDAPQRRLRLAGEAEPGWWEFEVEGRRATPVRRAEPGDLSGLPAVRGHYACGWLFLGGGELERIALPGDVEPEPLAPCTGRRWYSGEVLLDGPEFEDEPESRARDALEQGRGIADVKGVAPSLRAAFGFAVARAAGAALEIPISPREAAAHIRGIADGGRPAAEQLLRRVRDERERHRILSIARDTGRHVSVHTQGDPAERAELALDGAGARLLRARRVGQRQLEVAFQFMGERFVSIVDTRTMQVIDAGICLSGADDRLTLDSLPSAIREAIDTGQLYITRH